MDDTIGDNDCDDCFSIDDTIGDNDPGSCFLIAKAYSHGGSQILIVSAPYFL